MVMTATVWSMATVGERQHHMRVMKGESGSVTSCWKIEVPKYTRLVVMAAALALANRLCVMSISPKSDYPKSQTTRKRIQPEILEVTL